MNKVILMGRLTKDPELRYTAANTTAWATFTLAVNRRFSKPGEEKQADFISIVAFGKTAEFCSKYFKKGQQVAVSGRIQTRSWDDQEGKKRYATDVVAEDVYFADSKRDSYGGGEASQFERTPFPKQTSDPMPNDDFFSDDDNDNDVPF